MARSGDVGGRVHRVYVWVGDRQVHVRRSGPAGARSPLLVIHAAHSSSAPLEPFMAEMGRERSVIAPDLPGAGMSDALNGPGDGAAQAGALLEVVADLGFGMVDILGIKDGGAIAVEMARQQPEIARKIILVSAPPPGGLMSQPLLALDMPGFPDSDPRSAAATIRAFLDT